MCGHSLRGLMCPRAAPLHLLRNLCSDMVQPEPFQRQHRPNQHRNLSRNKGTGNLAFHMQTSSFPPFLRRYSALFSPPLFRPVRTKFNPAHCMRPKTPVFVKIVVITLIITLPAVIVVPVHFGAIRMNTPRINRSIKSASLKVMLCPFDNGQSAYLTNVLLSRRWIFECEQSHRFYLLSL